jgi:hypothetical protein
VHADDLFGHALRPGERAAEGGVVPALRTEGLGPGRQPGSDHRPVAHWSEIEPLGLTFLGMLLYGSMSGVPVLVRAAKVAGSVGLAICGAVRVAALGAQRLPAVRVLRGTVPGAILGLAPTKAERASVRKMRLGLGHT